MNVADIELCRELYELSGWQTGEWHEVPKGSMDIPAYTLGYLLKKLPPSVKGNGYGGFYLTCIERDKPKYSTDGELLAEKDRQIFWEACYRYNNSVEADTPENAACKLATELFKRGVFDGR